MTNERKEMIRENRAAQEAVGDKFGKRVIFTKKKMGAQTLEASPYGERADGGLSSPEARQKREKST